jgi:Xaa-Pro dipeptidase
LTELYAAHVATLARGYARALAASGYDAVVLHSGSLKKRSEFDDQYWRLRPTPHFAHWSPLAEIDCALVVMQGAARLIRPTTYDFWEKPAPPDGEHWRELDVVEVKTADDVKAHLPRGKRIAFVGEDRARAASWGIDDVNPAELVNALDALRTTKTPYEVLCIAEANRIAAVGHEAVVAAFLTGDASELDLHLRYLAATSQDDAETPYKNIFALGAHAATLHHIAYGKVPRSRSVESLLVDAGATYQGYGSDVTRTWVRGAGATASAFKALVDGIERMQQRLCAAVTHGAPYEALHDESHRQIAAILRDVGIAKASAETLVASGTTRAFFPHGLGHSLGLQTHDVGCALVQPRANNPFLRNTSKIAVDQVFTIEPGVYFIDALLAPLRESSNDAQIDWKLVGALTDLGGVRIEDDLLVTPGAHTTRNFTREHLPLGGGAVDALSSSLEIARAP